MAHELEMIHGKAAMAYTKRSEADVPWHGLGNPVPEGSTPNEMLKAAKLDWTVEKKSAMVNVGSPDAPQWVPTGQEALVRSDIMDIPQHERGNGILTTVGERWNPVQNHEAFEFFEKFVEAGQMQMETAGSLKNGQIVWALAKTSEAFCVFGEDVVESYVLFTNPHQYGKTLDIRFTPIRVVCNNTLTLAHTTQSGTDQTPIRLNHRQPFDKGRVQDIMGLNRMRMNNYGQMAKLLGNHRAEDEMVDHYLKTLLLTPQDERDIKSKRKSLDQIEMTRTAKKIKENITEQPGAGIREGSWWQVFNAVTYTVDHQLGRENSTRLESAWYGANARRKWDALELAGKYINYSPSMAA